MMLNRPSIFLPALTGFMATLTVYAAPITWNAATDTTGKTQLIEGNLVVALHGGPSAATVSGGGASGTSSYAFTAVNFTSLSPHTFVATTGGPTPRGRTTASCYTPAAIESTGDADFDTMIQSMTDAWGTTAGITAGTLTLHGLTDGTDYLIQVFFNDQRDAYDNRVMTFGDGSGHTVNIAGGDPAAGVQTSHYGQQASGLFTASGTSQNLTMLANGFGNIHFNAILVTQTGPPPSPDTPTNLVATGGDTEIDLDWDDNIQFGFDHFIVYRALASGGPFAPVPGATPTASSYTDTGLVNGTPYFYKVTAVNTLTEESGFSDPDSATPMEFVPDPPEVPTGLTVTPGNNRNILNWDDNTQPGFKEFRVKRSEDMGGPYGPPDTTTQSAYTDTTAVNGTTYYYVVTAVNIDDDESAPSVERSGTPNPSAEPPNFLFIITDDQDTYSVGAYRRTEPAEHDTDGQPYVVDTPHIDRLAAEGMLFHQARLMGANSGAVCQPSRTTIMTGKNTWQRTAGVSAAVTFPGIFNRGVRSGLGALPYATYRTCKIGNSYPTANGEFTIVNDDTKRGNTDGNGSEWHANHGIDYIDHWQTNHRPNNKPFLIYLGFSHPHDTRNARTNPNLTGRYNCINTTNPGGLVLNPNAPPLPINHLSCTPATYPAHPFDHGHLNVRDEVSVSGIGQYRTEAVVRNEIGRNLACVDWIDRQLGDVLAKLEDPNGDGDPSDSVIENTYIVFTSDHGIAIGRHGIQGKQNLYEHTWRVPYIVRGPGITAGSETDALIYLHDTFPTFCDLAGIDLPSTIDGNDGQSFRAVLEGTQSTSRETLYGLYAGGDKPGMRAVTDGRFKLLKYDVGSNATQVTQLFDLQENPFELLPEHGVPNLATQPAYTGIRQRLEERLMEQRIENADPYAFLGDRTLLRFEDGDTGQAAGILSDRFPFANHGTAHSGNGGTAPAFSALVPHATDLVVGEANTRSLDFEQDQQHYVQVADARELDFGNAPFTIEAWVKLETLPSGDDLASAMPVAMKKVIGAGDGGLDYMFLAAAGNYGSASTYANLALHLGTTTLVSDLAIPDTNWHHISVALDPVSNIVRFTLGNLADSQSTSAHGTANNGPLVIGAHYNSDGAIDSAFDGLLDEVSITDGFLDPAELQPFRTVAPAVPFQVLSQVVHADGGTLDLTFESDDTLLYHVQQTTTLPPGIWSHLRQYIPGATGINATTVSGLPIDPELTQQFFRIYTEN